MSRFIRYFALVAAFSLAFSACDCSDDPGTDGSMQDDCEHTDDCPAGEECVDGVCVDPGEPADTGPDADPDPGPDVGPGADTDADTDADTGPEPDPDCPDPNTCEDYGADCGWIPDGCGGTVNCGGCPGGYSCGAGDDQNQCVPDDCVSDVTCESANVDCGPIADGCGDMIDCGGCPEGYLCGVGPNAGQCISSDCQPLTCADHTPGECGTHPDGCGGFVDCGSCPAGHHCDHGECLETQCQPLTCADHGNPQCGYLPDGCGNTIHCGDCSGGQVCGTGAELGTCVDYQCQPLSCADYPDVNCGLVPDGCGDTINCGSCNSPEICGGGGLPNVCGADPSAGGDCTNFCLDQAICPSGQATTVQGTVYAPNGQIPIADATVYVPNIDNLDDLPPVEPAISCPSCEDMDLGDPLVGTISDVDGTFELRHVPANTAFPLVIRHGQWRRVVMIDPVNSCQTAQLNAADTSLPSRHQVDHPHDHIPKIAVTTGNSDALECLVHRTGIDNSEFSTNTGGGRIHIYNGGGAHAFDNGTSLPSAETLWNSPANFNDYDITLFSCSFPGPSVSAGTNQDFQNFADAGGRAFMTDQQKVWLQFGTPAFQSVAQWQGFSGPHNRPAFIDQSFAAGSLFFDWMSAVNALDPGGTFQAVELWDNIVSIDENLTDRWIYTMAGGSEQHAYFSFNTPVGASADNQCGRVVYSDLHVASAGDASPGGTFPSNCGSGANLSSQELALIYMFFDLAGCVTDDDDPPDPVCEPQTCADIGAECGMASDGCGDAIFCGDCPDPLICGANPGQPNQCGELCSQLTCADHGAQCGVVSDGCGGTIDCGPCPDGQQCGAGGVPNQCDCVPMECSDHGAECGEVSDGCGGTIDCGPCPDGQQCGASGIPNVCSGDCSPLSCDDHGAECGTVADGCGSTIDCGDCPEPLTCGGAGVPNQCGCTPLSCEDHGAECGEVNDGCGDILDCGECPHGACVDLQCVCLGLGEPCQHNSDCCSEMCGVGSDGEGTCITG